MLAFDTSHAVLSVTLLIGAGPAGSGHAPADVDAPAALHVVRDTGLHHAEHLAAVIRDLLADGGLGPADIDLVACAGGPGSFTGLRIGMATAKGFAAARQVPFRAVPTLDIWGALYAFHSGPVIPAIDARKGRFYAAVYDGGRRLTDDLDEPARGVVSRARERAGGTGTGGGAPAGDGSPGAAPPRAGSDRRPRAMLVCGPDAAAFAAAAGGKGLTVAAAADVVPSHALARRALVLYGAEGATPSGAGPTYVRKSDAELGR